MTPKGLLPMPNPFDPPSALSSKAASNWWLPTTGARLPKTPNPFVDRHPRAMAGGTDAAGSRSDRLDTDQLDGRYTQDGREPTCGPRRAVTLVSRRRAWCTVSPSRMAKPCGTAIGGSARDGRRRPRSAAAPARVGAQTTRQHQRRRYRGPRLRGRRSRQFPVELSDIWRRNATIVRGPRSWILHRSSAPRSDHRRDPRDRL